MASITKFPGTVANGYSGTSAWVNLNNAKTDDGTYASCFLVGDNNDDSTYGLFVSNFGFSIPSDATINGIEVICKEKASVSDDMVNDVYASIVSNNYPVGNDKSTQIRYMNTTDTNYTYGSSSDKWGWTAITPAKINDPSFGFQIGWENVFNWEDITLNYDTIKITIYYTSAVSTNIKTVNGLAKVSVKKFNGLAIDSVKSINELI